MNGSTKLKHCLALIKKKFKDNFIVGDDFFKDIILPA